MKYRGLGQLLLIVLLGAFGPLASVWADTSPTCDIRPGELQLDGGTLHYNRAGRGPKVLLLHGLFAQKEQWDAFLCQLAAAGFSGLAPDLPGFGQSTGFALRDYRLERQADLIHRLVEALGINTLDVAGNSMGGAVAVLYAKRHPQGVRSLALVGAPLGAVEWGPRVKAALYEGVNPFIPIDIAQFDREMRLLFANPPVIPKKVKQAAVAEYVEHNRHYQQVWDIVNLYDTLLYAAPGLAIPTLILWGEQDGIYAVEGASALQARLPGSQLVTLPETGHLPMLERPEETATLYQRFLGLSR